MGAEFTPPGGVQLTPAWRCGVELGRYLRFPPPMDLGSYALLRWGKIPIWDCLSSCHKARLGTVWSGTVATPSKWAAVWFPLRYFGPKVSTSRSSLLRSSLHCCGVRDIRRCASTSCVAAASSWVGSRVFLLCWISARLRGSFPGEMQYVNVSSVS